MNDKKVKKFSRKAHDHFGDNILFSFIGGSYGKGNQKKNSDIDIFILLKEENYEQEKDFLDYFKKFHKEKGLKFDHAGEILDKKTLDNLLDETETIINKFPGILDVACYQADCLLSIWRKGDIIMKFFLDPRICIRGDEDMLNKYINRSEKYFEKYPKERIQKEKGKLIFPSSKDIEKSKNLLKTYHEMHRKEDYVDTPSGIQLSRWFSKRLHKRLCPKAYLPKGSKKRCVINKQCLGTYSNFLN